MKTCKSVLKEMLFDVNKINKANIDFVAENFPAGEYKLCFTKLTVNPDDSFEDRKSGFFLVYHDCLEHKVRDSNDWGYKFLETLYNQI
jgi:hypothetical protein